MSTSLSGIISSISTCQNPTFPQEPSRRPPSMGSPRLLLWAPTCSPPQWAALPSALACDLACGWFLITDLGD